MKGGRWSESWGRGGWTGSLDHVPHELYGRGLFTTVPSYFFEKKLSKLLKTSSGLV